MTLLYKIGKAIASVFCGFLGYILFCIAFLVFIAQYYWLAGLIFFLSLSAMWAEQKLGRRPTKE